MENTEIWADVKGFEGFYQEADRDGFHYPIIYLCLKIAAPKAPGLLLAPTRRGLTMNVQIKALEWQKVEGEFYETHRAETPFGVYGITAFSRLDLDHPIRLQGLWCETQYYRALDDAKAAAQTDYETRILSSLLSSPGKDGGQEVERPYNTTFNAIAKAVTVNTDGSIGISVRAFWEAFDEYTSAPQPARTAQIEAAQITMGRGLVDVSRIKHEGRAGILFRPRDEQIPVGEEGELQPGEYWPVKGDVVIWIENEGGARVIQNYLSAFIEPFSHCDGTGPSETSTADKAAQIAERYNVDPWIVREIRALYTQPTSMALIERLTKALEPFAKCADEIDYDDKERDEPTPDDEWAKFRLLVGDYRRARSALSASQSTSREGER